MLKEPLPRGVQIELSDLALTKASLGTAVRGYITSTDNVVGSITRRNLNEGELLNFNDLSDDASGLTTESLSISILATDIPPAALPGDIVSLYQVHDQRNGEEVLAPVQVLTNVFIREISRKSANFGSEISLTVTIDRDDVATLLQATSSGRIVVVSTRG